MLCVCVCVCVDGIGVIQFHDNLGHQLWIKIKFNFHLGFDGVTVSSQFAWRDSQKDDEGRGGQVASM